MSPESDRNGSALEHFRSYLHLLAPLHRGLKQLRDILRE
jgi:hypothetical protein